MLAWVIAVCQLPARPQELLLVLFTSHLCASICSLVGQSQAPSYQQLLLNGAATSCAIPQEGADVGHEDPFAFQDVSADAGLFCKKSGTVTQTCR